MTESIIYKNYMIRFCGDVRAYKNRNNLLIIAISIILSSIVLVLPICILWCKKRQYFPLKERSSLLTLMLVINFQLLFWVYPIMMLYFFLTYEQNNESDGQFGIEIDLVIFRAMIITQQAFALIIYILRSARILFAHKASISQRNTVLFNFFKNQINMIILGAIMLIIRITPPLARPQTFYTPIDNVQYMKSVSSTYDQLNETVFQLRQIILVGYFFICSYAVYQQRHINKDYAIMKQLLPMLVLAIIIEFIKLLLYKVYYTWNCNKDKTLSYGLLLQMFEGFLSVLISLGIPLYNATAYRKGLPIKTIQHQFLFDSFLNQRISLQIFYQYLHQYSRKDQKNAQQYQIMLSVYMRHLRNRLEGDSQPLLKGNQRSILQRCGFQINKMTNNDLYEKAQDLLFKIYTTKYKYTISHKTLTQILKDNDRAMTNLVLMNMTVICRKLSSIQYYQ